MAYKIGNIVVKDREYKQFKTTQVTTNIHSEYLKSYKELMQTLNKPMSAGFSCMLELLLNDQEILDKFVDNMRYKY